VRVDVVPLLRGRFGRPFPWVERCASTQRLLDGAAEGAVAVTDEQTEGRGRLGRSWDAPPGTSLLFSVVLTPRVPSERLPELSVVAGEAVAQAIASETGLATTVKPPNDVLVGGKKVAGILAESSEGRVVLGVGVNVNQTADELPRDTETEPTSLRIEVGERIDRAPLLAAILLRLERDYERWVSGTSASG
jgi:BirA family biotin operon repressor/biotin-[acetyl-CoA-carboxylase] ligase